METSGLPERPELILDKSPQEIALLTHIKEVNDKRLELGREAIQLHNNGDLDGCLRKKRGCAEARKYLNSLVAKHKRLYWRRK